MSDEKKMDLDSLYKKTFRRINSMSEEDMAESLRNAEADSFDSDTVSYGWDEDGYDR